MDANQHISMNYMFVRVAIWSEDSLQWSQIQKGK